jgi:hypothetical protein
MTTQGVIQTDQTEEWIQDRASEALPLIKNLSAKSHRERIEARQRLKDMGRQAIPALTAATEDDDPEVSLVARELLKELNVYP